MSAAIAPPVREPATWEERIRGFLRSQRLTLTAAAVVAALIASPLILRETRHPGQTAFLQTAPSATIVYPASEAIEEQQPILEWRSARQMPRRLRFAS